MPGGGTAAAAPPARARTGAPEEGAAALSISHHSYGRGTGIRRSFFRSDHHPPCRGKKTVDNRTEVYYYNDQESEHAFAFGRI